MARSGSKTMLTADVLGALDLLVCPFVCLCVGEYVDMRLFAGLPVDLFFVCPLVGSLTCLVASLDACLLAC